MEVLHSSLVTCLQFRIAMLTVSYRYDVTSFARSSDMCIAIDYNLQCLMIFSLLQIHMHKARNAVNTVRVENRLVYDILTRNAILTTLRFPDQESVFVLFMNSCQDVCFTFSRRFRFNCFSCLMFFHGS